MRRCGKVRLGLLAGEIGRLAGDDIDVIDEGTGVSAIPEVASIAFTMPRRFMVFRADHSSLVG